MGKIPAPGPRPLSFEQDKSLPYDIQSSFYEAMAMGMNNLESVGYVVAKTGCTLQEARWIRQQNMYTFQRP